jgi:hypothetical protein
VLSALEPVFLPLPRPRQLTAVATGRHRSSKVASGRVLGRGLRADRCGPPHRDQIAGVFLPASSAGCASECSPQCFFMKRVGSLPCPHAKQLQFESEVHG